MSTATATKVELVIYDNPLDYNQKTIIETDNVMDALMDHFDQFPQNAKLFHNEISEASHVTPYVDDNGVDVDNTIEHLQSLEGTIYCIVKAEFFLFTLFAGGNLFAIFLLGLLAYLLRPTNPEERNTADNSPNNGLSDRTNSARLNARIPDIYGTVRSTPDLINDPYFTFENQREIEWVYLCIGRGEYEIDEVQDGETPIEDIAGISYAIYGPNTSPNNGVPQFEFGTPITERIWGSIRSNAVDGQLLRAPDSVEVTGDNDIGFIEPDQIVALNANQDIDFEEYFAEGDVLTITDSQTNGNTVNLDGTYSILSVTADTISLANPGNVNANWNTMFTIPDGTDANLTSTGDKWIGPFRVEDAYEVSMNFTAEQGLYRLNRQNKQFAEGVDIEVEYTEVDRDGVPLGLPVVVSDRISGSAELQNDRNLTIRFQLPVTESTFRNRFWEIRVRRSNDKVEVSEDERLVDQVKWRDLYALAYIDKDDFGDITTAFVKTAATSGALSIKERKFNLRSSRLIFDWDQAGVLSPNRIVSSNPAAIIRDIALDPSLGNMQSSELDEEQMRDEVIANKTYFGTDFAAEFNHTFDDKDTSTEEMILAVARATHFVAFRQGGQLKLSLDAEQTMSKVVFNHRNKIPATELRTVSFGTSDDYDGVELDWVNPDDGAIETYRVPDAGENNPKKIETVGIQSQENAYIHSWREWNKIRYRRHAVEFDATSEALTLIRNERIDVADNTRPDVDDGHCVSLEGLLLRLSQPFEADPAKEYVIHLSLFDKTVQVIDIQPTDNEYYVVLDKPPRLSLILEEQAPNKPQWTPYQIVSVDNQQITSFIVQEIRPEDNFNINVRCYNYDERYFQNDLDINAGVFVPDTGITVLFRANFESFDLPDGTFALFEDPEGFESNGSLIEIQNNVSSVGPSREGTHLMELDGGAIIHVDLTTDPNNDYELLLWYSPRPGFDQFTCRIDVYWNGTFFIQLASDGSNYNNGEPVWEPVLLRLPSPTGATTRLEFRSFAPGGNGGLLDDIRVKQITNDAPTAFSPGNIAGQLLWLDASDENNFDLDGIGGDAAEIDQWNDLSPQGNHAIQISNSQRPEFLTDGTGGYVAFNSNMQAGDDTNQHFDIPAISPRTCTFVMEIDSGTASQIVSLMSSDGADTAPPPHDLVLLNPNQYSGAEYPTGDYAMSLGGEGASVAGTLWVNNQFIGTGSTPGDSSDIVTGQLAVFHFTYQIESERGFNILFGARDDDTGSIPDLGLSGKVREVIMYGTFLSGTNRTALYNYLADKWRIS